MSELYYKNNGLLIHQGLSALEYMAWQPWDATIHAISNSTTIFPVDWLFQRAVLRQQWWFFPTLNQYIQSGPNTPHPIEIAMELIFGETRANEIIELCERFGAWQQSLKTLNLAKAKRKAQAAVDAGLITAGEALQLRDLVEHINP